MDNYELNRLFRDTGFFKNLTHKDIYENMQCEILAYEELKRKYGSVYRLWCRVHMKDGTFKYQKVISNFKLNDLIFNCPLSVNYDMDDEEEESIYYFGGKGESFKFTPTEICLEGKNKIRKIKLFNE